MTGVLKAVTTKYTLTVNCAMLSYGLTGFGERSKKKVYLFIWVDVLIAYVCTSFRLLFFSLSISKYG